MSTEHRYIVSFIADNQPQSRTLVHDRETLEPAMAASLVKSTFPEFKDIELTDVQVQKRTKPEEGDNIPGHYQQP
ncbi:Uncharacterised protein [Pseudomonas fluorescens]|uniref:Uncharacterized protein n=1 Tax=Pseudomonas fluorescens TaxID=294 RepID=A0A3S4P8N2_PSEFL|nr:hypothetical protein [Pseudomonas fluorescens]VEF11415.1 Uncharacterised protein [Pseudomonas fluorescens]